VPRSAAGASRVQRALRASVSPKCRPSVRLSSHRCDTRDGEGKSGERQHVHLAYPPATPAGGHCDRRAAGTFAVSTFTYASLPRATAWHQRSYRVHGHATAGRFPECARGEQTDGNQDGAVLAPRPAQRSGASVLQAGCVARRFADTEHRSAGIANRPGIAEKAMTRSNAPSPIHHGRGGSAPSTAPAMVEARASAP